MSTVTTWLDGRLQTVAADDPRITEQEKHRKLTMHLANLRPLARLADRQTYLWNVERREGKLARTELETAFRAEWEALK
jgi:hypothetical protein